MGEERFWLASMVVIMRCLRCAIFCGLMLSCILFNRGWASEAGILRALENEIAAILENNRQGVVRIHVLYPRSRADDGPFGSVFTHGTGFIFDSKGYILTIDAAVKDAEEIRVILASGLQVKARMVGSDPISGIAVIRAEAKNLPTVKVGDSQGIRIGHYAFLLGNDFGNLVPAFGSVHEIYRDTDLIQVSARVQSSYGGAPMFCSNGRVGGMVWRYQDPVRAIAKEENPLSQSLFGWSPMPSSVFVIPINRALRVARALLANGHMTYGRLGVEVAQRGNEVVVVDVQPGSPAIDSGIRPDDVVLSFRGRQIAGPVHLRRMVMESSPGEMATLGIRREGRVVATQVKLSKMVRPTLTASDPAPAVTSKDAVIYQQINNLQQEVGRLWQILQRK